MPMNRRQFLEGSLSASALPFLPAHAAASLPRTHSIHAEKDGSIVLKTGKQTATFRPRLSVLIAEADPQFKMELDRGTNFRVPAWNVPGKAERTMDLFQAAEVISLEAQSAEITGDAVRWKFPAHARFQLRAEVRLPKDGTEPIIHFQMTALAPGWYAVGYTGAPETPKDNILRLWQPLVWQEQRFPAFSFFSMEPMCPMPATLVRSNKGTIGVAVEPSESPFRLATFPNARFGVVLRNTEGKAQPMAFVPAFGNPDSRLQTGQSVSLRVRVLLRDEEWFDTYRYIARNIYKFHDYRSNGPASLNTTLDNMIDLVMNDTYCGWINKLKGFDYRTDVPGTVKVVSALHPLSLAIIRDSPEMYRRRALPILEFMLSREKFLYSESEAIRGQNASHKMKGPCAEVSELAALYSMSQKRNPVLRYYADTLSKQSRSLNLKMTSLGNSFQNLLALYRMTGDLKYLEQATAAADTYIAKRVDQPQKDFGDVHVDAGGQFWTDFAPKWIDLLELYETTREARYLKAAEAGAREYSEYVWMQPVIPTGSVLVNKNSQTSITPRNDRHIPDRKPIIAAEQMVPSWRISQVGLTPEAASTYPNNPGIFLTHFAAYMLRLAHYTQDNFFHDIARSAVVGRYENYPGYNLRVEYTTTYQHADFPLRPWEELTYNDIFYNHIMPHIALLFDFLLTDAFTRSKGEVEFPSQYAQGYSYLQSKVYGDRKGTIYGEPGVQLYMPRNLVYIESPEVNYVAGYKDSTLYLILTNQCEETIETQLRFDTNTVPLDITHNYTVRRWSNNAAGPPLLLKDGKLSTSLSSKGITVLAIDGISIATQFQSEYFAKDAAMLPAQSYRFIEAPFGTVHGMLLSMGKNLVSAYVWLEADEQTLTEARLYCREKEGNTWRMFADLHYPYEFSIPVKTDGFEYYIEGVKTDQSVVRSENVILHCA
jgi:hypothetical protein